MKTYMAIDLVWVFTRLWNLSVPWRYFHCGLVHSHSQSLGFRREYLGRRVLHNCIYPHRCNLPFTIFVMTKFIQCRSSVLRYFEFQVCNRNGESRFLRSWRSIKLPDSSVNHRNMRCSFYPSLLFYVRGSKRSSLSAVSVWASLPQVSRSPLSPPLFAVSWSAILFIGNSRWTITFSLTIQQGRRICQNQVFHCLL